LDDGVADTLASGNTSAGHQPSCYSSGSAATTMSPISAPEQCWPRISSAGWALMLPI